MTAAKPKSYWDGLAQAFARLGPPLRPSAVDIRFVEDTIATWATAHKVERLRGTMLGVTPELAQMGWPKGSQVLAVDKSMAMAQAVWPGDVPNTRAAVCGNWTSLPRRASSCHVVVGDGSLNCVLPEEFRELAESVAQVLTEDGLFTLRCYLQNEMPEDPADVYADLCSGRVQSFHAFKLRLLMALQKSGLEGIAVRDVWKSWVTRKLDLGALVARYGRPTLETIELYCDSDTVYAFPTIAELHEVLLPVFEGIGQFTPGYEMGDRCPTLVLRPWRNRRNA